MKLWNVNVSVEIDMPVVAETEEEAEEIARANFQEESTWGDDPWISAREITFAAQLPQSFKGAIPWGSEDDLSCESLLPTSEPSR